jgi:hypothetical protein
VLLNGRAVKLARKQAPTLGESTSLPPAVRSGRPPLIDQAHRQASGDAMSRGLSRMVKRENDRQHPSWRIMFVFVSAFD